MLLNLKVGKRLAVGFGLVIALSLSASSISIWQLRGMAHQAEVMSLESMAKERLISDLNLVINAAVRRTLAIAKSKDETLTGFFAQDARDTSEQASDILEKLKKHHLNPQEQAVFDKMLTRRGVYYDAKESIAKSKKAGSLDQAEKALDQQFLPAAKGYLEAVAELLAIERKNIDQESTRIEELYNRGALTVALSSALIALVGLICSVGIGRGLLGQLGGEPTYAAEVAKAIAAGKLNNPIELKAGDQASLLYSMKSMQQGLALMVEGVRSGAEAIADASAVIAHGNADLSSRTEEQAASLEQTSASMDELTLAVKHNVGSALEARRLATSAAEIAVRGGEVVKEVVQTMSEINNSSRRVVDIISVIDAIAFQTNILALNAAVEAARAGDQGRGFAVVASEVRGLAGRSATAAKEIKALILESVKTVEQGSVLVNMAGETMEGVVEGVEKVSSIIASISKASSEQSEGIEQVDVAINHMDKATQQNAALVEQAAISSQTLRDQAEQLMDSISVFELSEPVTVWKKTR